jgi:hypothetical protein
LQIAIKDELALSAAVFDELALFSALVFDELVFDGFDGTCRLPSKTSSPFLPPQAARAQATKPLHSPTSKI